MQTLLHLYTLLLLIYLTVFRSLQEVKTSKLLWAILLLIAATTALHAYALLDQAPLADRLQGWVYLAQSLYIPAIYLYFHNQYHHQGLQGTDLLHLTPFVLMGLDLFGGPLLLALGLPQGVPPLLLLHGCTAVYFLLLLLLGRAKAREWLRAPKKSHKLFSVIRTKPTQASRTPTHYPVDGLGEQKVQQMNELIQQALQSSQAFLQRRYSLKDLAADTQIPLHHLSAFINQHCQVNFNDFINEYRVQYSQQKMRNRECTLKKLETIAKESGFNNRNTFTAAFKKVTGLTPSQFLREVNHPSQPEAALPPPYEALSGA